MTCPRCSAETDDAVLECPSCGVVFAKWRARAPPEADSADPASMARAAPPPAWSPGAASSATLGIPDSGWKAAGIGLAMAVALTFFPLLAFLLGPLTTLVHEIGHTAVLWIFGYYAVPAFDFLEGGGASVTFGERSPLIVLVWVAGLAALGWWQRERKGVLVALGIVALGYFLAFGTRAERLLVSMSGHGGQIAFGAVFLYRGVTGWGCTKEVERPLSTFVGFVMLFANLDLGFLLLGTSLDKALYLQGKSYVDNDLVMGALYLGWTVESLARALILATGLAIPAAFVAAAIRRRIGLVSDAEE